MARLRLFCLVGVLSLVGVVACSERRAEVPVENPDVKADEAQAGKEDEAPEALAVARSAPMIPFEGGVHKPSLAKMEGAEEFSREHYLGQAECAECHAEVAAEWKDSMHSFASLSNNMYMLSLNDFIEERGADNAKFCAGCHDPALMLDDEVPLAIAPEPASAHVGVGCVSCHGATEATIEGNGSYTLSTARAPVPTEGDAESLKQHLAAVGSTTLRTNELCVSCHRGFLTPEMGHEIVLAGLDEFGPWRRSVYNENSTWRIDDYDGGAQNCVSCHMPEVDGHKSHRFAGGHSTFAAMIGSQPQLDAVKQQLEGAAALDVFVLDELPSTMAARGEHVIGFDVVMFNERVGHSFPGGVKDLRDTWLEVVIKDRDGEVIATSGVEHARTGKEDYTFILHARLASEDGETQRKHTVASFRTPVYDNTIKPRDATVARYALELPEELAKDREGISIQARLRHRRVNLEIAMSACVDFHTDRGKAFEVATKKHKGVVPNPCVEQPIIDVAEASAVVGRGLEGGANAPAKWRRYYRYGLGLLHHTQENLEETRRAFRLAEGELTDASDAKHRAMVVQGLAMVSARQGRTDEAVELFEQADRLVGGHPSTHYNIGEANMRVWRFEKAAAAFERADGVANDARILRRWAIALGSIQEPEKALEVAQRGLAFESRDPHLLRSQMLAYRNLEASKEWRSDAEKVYNAYKRDVKAPHVRDKCSRGDDVCRAERTPVGVRWLTPAKAKP